MKLPPVVVCLLAVMPWIGCVTKPPLRQPVAKPPEQVQPSAREVALTRLLGSWELTGKDGKIKQIVFDSNGEVTFRGGLEYFNPGTWQLNADAKELKITLPNTPNEKLDIFHMYIGNGVKAFDRSRKEITYEFDIDTWNLNVAGWTYSKPDKPAAAPEAEPVFK